MYVSDGASASRLLLSLMFEMLESPQMHTKIHAFNLLWNLSIHMNLLEEIITFEENGKIVFTSLLSFNLCCLVY